MNSTRKLNIFYCSGFVILLITAAALVLMTGHSVETLSGTLPTPSVTP